MITTGAISLVVVLTAALALTLNGDALQGFFRLNFSGLRASAPAVTPVYQIPSRQNLVPMRPLSLEPPVTPEPPPVNDPITRAELAKLIVDAMKVPLTTSGGPHFPDVAPGVWYYPYVETAYSHGWMVGYPDGTFKPANTVNRAEAAKIFTLSVVFNCSNSHQYPYNPYYQDTPSTQWFYGAVNRLADCKMVDILPGPKSNYFPATLLSNGRAQYMITNAKNQGWIPK